MPCSGCSVLHGGNSQWKEKNWGICKMQKLYSNPGYGSGTLWGQQNRKYQLFESMTLDLTSILLNILHGEKDIISYFLFEISVKNFTFSSKDNDSTSVLVTLTHSLLILPFSTPLKTVHFKFWFDKGPPLTSWKFAHSSHLEKSPSQWTPPQPNFYSLLSPTKQQFASCNPIKMSFLGVVIAPVPFLF